MGESQTSHLRDTSEFDSFISRVLNDLTLATMQSEQDAVRIRELGFADDRIVAVGNLKFDSAGAADDKGRTIDISGAFRFC
jgi:3-deoxy-D-manno-octulosonic-acid transferase